LSPILWGSCFHPTIILHLLFGHPSNSSDIAALCRTLLSCKWKSRPNFARCKPLCSTRYGTHNVHKRRWMWFLCAQLSGTHISWRLQLVTVRIPIGSQLTCVEKPWCGFPFSSWWFSACNNN
jgi:hypothetical protein